MAVEEREGSKENFEEDLVVILQSVASLCRDVY
jgi:hypothetical protein